MTYSNMELCHAHETNHYIPTITFLSPLFKNAKTFVYRSNDVIARTLAYMANPDLNMIAIQNDISNDNFESPIIYCGVNPITRSEKDVIIHQTPDRTTSQIIWNILTDDDYDSTCTPTLIRRPAANEIPRCSDCCMKIICECDD